MSSYSDSYRSKEYDKSLYGYEVFEYFYDSLKGVTLDEKNIAGMQGWNDGIYEYIICMNASLMIDEENFNDRLYFYIAENRGWYSTHACRYIYFYYEDKCYEIYLQFGRWDINSGKFEVCGNVSIHEKSFIELDLFNLHFYHDRSIRAIDYKDNAKEEYFDFLLEKDQNLITEIIKRFRGNNKKRNRNDSNNKGM